MKRTPYFTKDNLDSSDVELWFHNGTTAELIFTFHIFNEHLAYSAEKIANDAYHRGRLAELQSANRRGAAELDHIKALVADLS